MKEGWEIKKLGDVVSTFSGYTPSAELLHKTGEYPYFKVAEMNRSENLKIMSSTDAYIDNPAKVYRKGAIVFPKNGAAISTNKKRILGQDSVVDLNTGGFMADESQITPFFLYYFMQHIDFKQYVRRGAVPTLDIKELKNKAFHIPPVQEQEKIVAELDCLSGIIEKKKEQLKELEHLAQSIFYDMFGNPITNEKDWEVKKMGDVCEIKNGRNQKAVENPNGCYPIYGSGGIMGYADDYICEAGTTIVGRKGTINKPLFVNTAFWNVDTAFGLQPFASTNPRFLFFTCKSIDFNHYNKSTTLPSLVKSDLLKINVVVPPLDLQNEFARKIEVIETHKELIRQSIKEAEMLLNSRMDYWFN